MSLTRQPAIKSTTYSQTLVQHIIEAKPAVHRVTATVLSATWLTVDENADGQRLDNFLMRHLKGVPKTHVYRIIRSGEVRINKGRAQAESRVCEGDVIRIPPIRTSAPPTETSGTDRFLATPAREFDVLLEDEHLLVIDKPAGVAVHGGSGVSFGVIEQLRRARPQAKFLELVHRLDRETSGALLLAKKRSALTRLQDQFRERETGKTYLALVIGHWPANKKVLDKPLVKFLLPPSTGGPGNPAAQGAEGERRVRVTHKDDPDGMKSVTLVKVAQRLQHAGADYTQLEVTIKTGRTHQIRVHLASEGYPIAGDDKYGNFDQNRTLQKQGLKRMYLHAWQLQFNHPASGERCAVRAELPPELARFGTPHN